MEMEMETETQVQTRTETPARIRNPLDPPPKFPAQSYRFALGCKKKKKGKNAPDEDEIITSSKEWQERV